MPLTVGRSIDRCRSLLAISFTPGMRPTIPHFASAMQALATGGTQSVDVGAWLSGASSGSRRCWRQKRHCSLPTSAALRDESSASEDAARPNWRRQRSSARADSAALPGGRPVWRSQGLWNKQVVTRTTGASLGVSTQARVKPFLPARCAPSRAHSAHPKHSVVSQVDVFYCCPRGRQLRD